MGLSDAIERLLGGAPAPNASTVSHAHGHSVPPVASEPVASERPGEATNGGPAHSAPRPPVEGAAPSGGGSDQVYDVSEAAPGHGANGDAPRDEPVASPALTGSPLAEPLPVDAPVEAEPTLTRHAALPLAGTTADATPDGPALPPAPIVEGLTETPLPEPVEQRVGWEPAPPTLRAASTDDTFPSAWSPRPEDDLPELPDELPVSPVLPSVPAPADPGLLNGAGHAPSPVAALPPEADPGPGPTDAWSPPASEPALEVGLGPSTEMPGVPVPPAVAAPLPAPPDIVPAPYEWDAPATEETPAHSSSDAPPSPLREPAAPAGVGEPPVALWEPAALDDPVVDVEPPLVAEEPPAPAPHTVPIEPEAGVTPEAPAAAPDPDAAEVPARPVPELPPVAEVGFEQLEATATIVESLGLGYHLGSAIERIVLSETRGVEGLPSLREAIWLIERHIELAKGSADAEALATIRGRLVRNGDVIAGLQALSVAVDARRSGGPVPAPSAPPAAERPSAASATVPARPSRPAAADPVAAAPEAPASLLADALRRTPPGAEHDDIEDYPLGREILVMAVRFGLILVVIVVVVLVITLAATLT